MIRDVVHSIGGIGLYGTVSTVLFLAVFAGVILRVVFMKRADIDRAKALPLDPDDVRPDRERGER